jgi:competence protein ComEC
MDAEETTTGPNRGVTAQHRSAMPLFHAAWLFAAGIAASQWLPLRPSYVLVAFAAISALCVVATLRAQRIVWLPLAALWLLLGCWCAQMEPHPAPAPQLAALSDGLLRTVEGTVIDTGPVRAEMEQSVDEPSIAAPTQRLDIRASTLEVVTDDSDLQAQVQGRIRLTVRWPAAPAKESSLGPEPFRCGDRIRAVVRPLPPETYHDPGAWSRADYLLDQGVTSTATVSIDRVERVGRVSGAFTFCRFGALQHVASARILALPAAMRGMPTPLRLSEDDAIMLAAMIAGDRTYLNRSLRAGFERTGSFHMLVVSGLHLAIVVGCIFWIVRRLRLARVPATLVTIAVSFGYALVTGFATPVQRSLWMVTLYLLGRILYRRRSAMNAIGFAALCLLALSPRSLFDSSFQMTLLAVVAIAGIAAPLLESSLHPYLGATRDLRLVAIDPSLDPKLAQFRCLLRLAAEAIDPRVEGKPVSRWRTGIAWRVLPWCIRSSIRIVELVIVSVVVEMAMALPMAVYFHRITIFALPVNLFIVPLLAVLVPAALLTLIAALLWPAAAGVAAIFAAIPLHFAVWLVRVFGSLRLGDFRTPSPLLWQSLAFVAFLAAAILLARGGHRQRRAAWAALVVAVFPAVAPRPVDRPRHALLMEAIDVGQGDSLLLITPDGKTLLIDGGGFGGGPRQAPQEFDIGEEVVSPALWARGIRRLDAVALSHAHSDHMGGLPAVLRNFRPAELWVGNNPDVASYRALLAEAAGLHVSVRVFRAGDAFRLGATQISVLAPSANYRPGSEPDNNDSLVLHVTYGATSVLLEGDAEAPIEQAMLAEPGLASTLLKVGHHGSITSTRPEFLARVAPQWAVISCGLHNRYGHPRGEVLAELQAARVRTFRTDLNGASCFVLDGKTTVADPFCAGSHPRARVESNPLLHSAENVSGAP